MDGSEAILASLGGRFLAQIASVRPDLVVKMPNQGCVDPTTLAPVQQPSAAPWVMFSVLDDSAERLAAGDLQEDERTWGSIVTQTFVPRDSGEQAARQLADTYRQFWRRAPLAGFRFWPTRVIPLGLAADDPAWWQVNTITQFNYEFTPPPA